MFKRVLWAAFLAVLVGNGLYKYLFKGVYHDHSQWDFIAHLNGFLWTMDGAPPQGADASILYFPPYLPIAFPIFDIFSAMDREIARLVWLFLLCAGMFFILLQMLRAVYFANGPYLSSDATRESTFLILFFWLFPATYLGLAAGQMSLFVITCLALFWVYRDRYPLATAAMLGIATIKISLALPFFLFLLLRQNYRQLGWVIGFSALFNGLACLFYLGPSGHFSHIRGALVTLETFGVNSPALMATSGRIDLAPFAAIFGITGLYWQLLAVAIFLAGIIWLFRQRKQLSDTSLILFLNLLIFALLYHRSYDLVIILFLALPLLRQQWAHIESWHILFFFPFVLPLQGVFQIGEAFFPGLSLLWHLIGTSTVVGLGGIWWLIRTERSYSIESTPPAGT